jgi:hypothetical protein
MGYPAASIGSRNRFIVNRHSQGLQVSPTLNLGLIPVFGNLSKYSWASLRAADRSRVYFSGMFGSRIAA